MSTTPAFRGRIESGKYTMDPVDRAMFVNYCQTLPDGEYKMVLKKGYKGVVNEQYGYLYTGIYETMARELGYSVVEIDRLMKSMFWFEMVDIVGAHGVLGAREKLLKSKTLMTTKDMGEYIDNIKRWWFELMEWHLPEPREVDYES